MVMRLGTRNPALVLNESAFLCRKSDTRWSNNEVTLEKSNEVLGEGGKTVQIDESKIGKRKYHRGHVVEGQWVFGGVEED